MAAPGSPRPHAPRHDLTDRAFLGLIDELLFD
jgi:hypothetical protein